MCSDSDGVVKHTIRRRSHTGGCHGNLGTLNIRLVKYNSIMRYASFTYIYYIILYYIIMPILCGSGCIQEATRVCAWVLYMSGQCAQANVFKFCKYNRCVMLLYYVVSL